MSNEKMENLLNLALDATEREREKSLDLDTGYDRAERTWEVIVKFGGDQGAGPGTEKSGADFRRQQRTFSGRCGIKGRDHRIPGAGAFQRA